MRKGSLALALILGLFLASATVCGIGRAAGQDTASAKGQAAGQGTGSAMEHGTATASVHVGPLKVTFADKTESWTVATLASLPHVTISVYNEYVKANQSYAGVPLTVLLTRVGVPDKPHGKDFRLYVLAEGSDGYGVVYSGGEVTPDVHDATVLVADALDGKPLAGNGPLQLVATGEKRPARWVRNLVSVRVLTAQ